MTTQNKRPSVKGKKKISSSNLGQAKGEEQKKPSFFSKRGPLLRPREEDSGSPTPVLEPVPEPAEDAGPKRRSVSREKERLARLSGLTKKWGKKGIACVASIVAVALIMGAFFVWNTYFRYDDAQDIKGEWLVSNGTVVVAIDAQSIRMPGDVSYAYKIDDQKKRITFTFSELSGGGKYDFSHGRKVLTVSEGNDGSAGETVFVKISDNAKAKPRIITEKQSKKYMSELAPQSLIPDEEAEASAEASRKEGGKKASSKKAS